MILFCQICIPQNLRADLRVKIRLYLLDFAAQAKPQSRQVSLTIIINMCDRKFNKQMYFLCIVGCSLIHNVSPHHTTNLFSTNKLIFWKVRLILYSFKSCLTTYAYKIKAVLPTSHM